MIPSAVRTMDEGSFGTDLECLDDDFNAAMAISKALLQHTARVFKDMPRVGTQQPAAERNIKKWTEEGLLERMDLGLYRKVK